MGYGIVFRVKGAYALFTRPEMKVERVSYDFITPSAARGIIEAIYWKPAIRWVIDKIHVLNPIEFTNIRRNEVSEKASESLAKQAMKDDTKALFIVATKKNRVQRASMVLKDVDYVIEAHFVMVPEKSGSDDTQEKHYNMALRRLRKGQSYSQPCLGTREFAATVTILEGRPLPASMLTGSQDMGWMLYDMDFSNPADIRPIFFRAVMQDGVIDLTQIDLVR